MSDALYGPQEYAPEFGPYGDLDGYDYVHEYPPEFPTYDAGNDYSRREAAYMEAHMDDEPREAEASGRAGPVPHTIRPLTAEDVEALNKAMAERLEAMAEQRRLSQTGSYVVWTKLDPPTTGEVRTGFVKLRKPAKLPTTHTMRVRRIGAISVDDR